MNKDLVILKHEQFEVDKADQDVQTLEESNDEQSERLKEMQKRIDAMYQRLGKTKLVPVPSMDERKSVSDVKEEVGDTISYDELYDLAESNLKSRGLDVDAIDFDDVLDPKEFSDLLEELDAPLPREQKWRKSDFIVVFIAGLIGSAVDLIVGNRDNALTGKGSKFSDKLNEIHTTKFKHSTGAPIDFQGMKDGFSFGGGNHRELSKGHDLLRFVDGIKMFKNGTFEAVAYENGVKHVVKTAFNQNGNPYTELPLITAILEYAHHMIADLFSNNSLPFPGYSFLRESKIRDLRIFSADMYANGFNCKNVLIQSVTAAIVEIIIRLYFSIQSVKEYKDSVEISEDFSNWEAVKKFFKPTSQDKLHEMLLVSHTIVLAVNVGKIVISEGTAIADINVAEILSVVKYGIKVTKAAASRNFEYAKLMYHAKEINQQWAELEDKIDSYDEALIAEMTETLSIA